jgi:hypothetical protein
VNREENNKMTIYDINEIKQKAIDYLASLRKEGLEEIGAAAIYITEFIAELEKETTKEGSDSEAV